MWWRGSCIELVRAERARAMMAALLADYGLTPDPIKHECPTVVGHHRVSLARRSRIWTAYIVFHAVESRALG